MKKTLLLVCLLSGISTAAFSQATNQNVSGNAATVTSVATTTLTGTLQASQEPAHTGDVTNTSGSLATVVGAINGVTLGATTATSGNLLIGSGTQWATQAITGDISIGSTGATLVNKIQGTAVSAPTGTGAVMLAASPTTTGTFTGAAANFSSNVTITGSGGNSGFGGALVSGSTAPSTIFYGATGTGDFTGIGFMNTNKSTTKPLADVAMGLASCGTVLTLDTSSNYGTGISSAHAFQIGCGTAAPNISQFTLSAPNYLTQSGGRAVNAGTTSDTIAASIASTYESANSATTTLTFAAPTGDGERRRICLKNASTVTWAVTSPATAVAGLPTTFIAGQCVEAVYNSASGTPANAPATTWVVY